MFEDIKKAQLVEKIRVMAATGQSGEEIKKSLSKEELDLMKSFNNDIEKGKAAQVGEIRVWQGKKMRKQANGKWVEVSDKGMTKKEHIKHTSKRPYKEVSSDEELRVWGRKKNEEYQRENFEHASKLSDKEYDESELEGYSDYKISDHKDSIDEHIDAIKSGGDKEHHLKYINIHKKLIANKTPSFTDAPHHQDNLKKYLKEIDDTIKKLSGKNKDLENKLSELTDKENLRQKLESNKPIPGVDRWVEGNTEFKKIDGVLYYFDEGEGEFRIYKKGNKKRFKQIPYYD